MESHSLLSFCFGVESLTYSEPGGGAEKDRSLTTFKLGQTGILLGITSTRSAQSHHLVHDGQVLVPRVESSKRYLGRLLDPRLIPIDHRLFRSTRAASRLHDIYAQRLDRSVIGCSSRWWRGTHQGGWPAERLAMVFPNHMFDSVSSPCVPWRSLC